MAEHNIQQLNRFKIERENTIQFPLRKMLKDSISEWLLSNRKETVVNDDAGKADELAADEHGDESRKTEVVARNSHKADDGGAAQKGEYPVAVVGYKFFHDVYFLMVAHGGVLACST